MEYAYMGDSDHKIALCRRRVVAARNAYIFNNSVLQQRVDSLKMLMRDSEIYSASPVLTEFISEYENVKKSAEELSSATKQCIQLQHEAIMDAKDFNFITK